MDRLDFTVIRPAVNEVARIEALAEPLGRKVLIAADLASVDRRLLEPLGYHELRGVRDPREIYGLDRAFKGLKWGVEQNNTRRQHFTPCDGYPHTAPQPILQDWILSQLREIKAGFGRRRFRNSTRPYAQAHRCQIDLA